MGFPGVLARHGWLAIVAAICAILLTIAYRQRAFEVESFEYRPLPDATEPDWRGRTDLWAPSPYPTPAIPLAEGFLFRAHVRIRDLSVLDTLEVAVDDLLADLEINSHQVFGPEPYPGSEFLSQRVREGFRQYAVRGVNTVVGRVVNRGGPTHLEFDNPQAALFGSQQAVASVALAAFALWVVLYRWCAPIPSLGVTVVVLLTLVVLFMRGFVAGLPYFGRGDWDQHFWFVETIRRTVVDYRALPLWNPYSDGGIPLVGYPQSYALDPLTPLSWIFGTLAGAKIIVLVASAFGSVGMFLFARQLGLRWEAAMAAAVLFQFNGATVQHLAEGHFAHHVNNWVPWSLLFFFRSRYRWDWNLLVSALLMAAVLITGEVYTLVFAAFGLGLWCVLEAFRIRSWQPARGMIGWLLVTGLVSAPRSLPVVEYGLLCARHHDPSGGFSLPILAAALFGRQPAYFFPPDQVHLWHEYGSYVGLFGAALAVIGAAATARRSWPALVTLIVVLWLSLGKFAFLNLWELVSTLPLLSSLRAPSRWNYAVLFFIVWFAAVGVDRIGRRLPRLAFMIPLVLFVDLTIVCSPLYSRAFKVAVTPPVDATGYRLRRNVEGTHPGRYSGLFEQVMGDVGVVESYNPVAPRRYAVPEEAPEYAGLVHLEGGDGKVELLGWTPREVRAHVATQRSAVLVYDQNYFPGWYAYVGEKRQRAFPLRGLVTTAVDPGEHVVILRYEPPLFWAGLAMAAAIIAISVTALRLAGRGQRGDRASHGRAIRGSEGR